MQTFSLHSVPQVLAGIEVTRQRFNRSSYSETNADQHTVTVSSRCGESDCHGLLRPNVVFFGETLDSHILTKVEKEMETCDLCLVVSNPPSHIPVLYYYYAQATLVLSVSGPDITWCSVDFKLTPVSLLPVVDLQVGTSSIVYPAAMFGPQIASRGVPVAEFNTKTTPKTEYFT